jgi:hypothetical protein
MTDLRVAPDAYVDLLNRAIMNQPYNDPIPPQRRLTSPSAEMAFSRLSTRPAAASGWPIRSPACPTPATVVWMI